MGISPFQYAIEKERSKIVKYFVEEIKVDTTLYDQVIVKMWPDFGKPTKLSQMGFREIPI